MTTAERKDCVLGSIVELYIRTGEPVGSKAVSAQLNDICSSATIRNDMCDLIERGYLIQPHTSAGRVPSADGFRYYIERLMTKKSLPNGVCNQILNQLPRFRGDPEQYMIDTGKILARITGCTAMVTTPVAKTATLKRLEVLQMGGTSVLVAILTSSGLMKSKLCQLDLPITQEEIQQFVQVINERFDDLPLSRINPAMAQSLAVSFGGQTLKFAPLLEQIFDAAQEAVSTDLFVEGQPNLLLYKEFSPAAVIELFARRESLIPYLNQCEGTAVYLGHELGDAALQQAGLVVTDYALKRDLKGKLAVLGPLKNDYSRLIPTLEFVAMATANHMNLYF